MQSHSNKLPEYIVFFDGVCNLCNATVNLLIDHDHSNKLRFAPLQGTTSEKVGIAGDLDSIVFFCKGKMYTQSAAALRIAVVLGGVWRVFAVFFLVPPFVRDALYAFIARNRYRWFGKSDSCRVPTPELRAKFLE